MYKIINVDIKTPDYTLFEKVIENLYSKTTIFLKTDKSPSLSNLSACYVLLRNGEPVGRYAFYENKELKYKEYKVAPIGCYECVNDIETSNILLKHAKQEALKKGYSFLIGPMEGSTWNNYRFSIHNKFSNFFMEFYNHDYYNHHFQKNGFSVIATYGSSIDKKLNVNNSDLEKQEIIFRKKGFIIRSINTNNFDAELIRLAEFSNIAFSNNFLFTPISNSDFANKYKKHLKLFDPNFVLIAERKGEIQGFIFAIHDYYDSENKTLIIKTLARKNTGANKGLGKYLAAKVISKAKELGYTQIIHAYMINSNASVSLSESYKSSLYKSYALYGVKL